MSVHRAVRAEDGVALPVATTVLLIVSLLAAVTASGAVQLSDTSNQDRDSKRALAAAEAGLQAATYRLNHLTVLDSQCLTNGPVLPQGGECAGQTESLGNGASYTYYVTPATPASACPITEVAAPKRCITSSGIVNGVQRRVQAAVKGGGSPLFPAAMVGLDSVTLSNSTKIRGEPLGSGKIGSNGQINLGNSAEVEGLEIGPAAPQPLNLGSNKCNGHTCTMSDVITRTAPWSLELTDVGTSVSTNANSSIPTGSGVTYSSSTRTLTLRNSSSLTLRGGTYNLCKIVFDNSNGLTVYTNEQVRIFLDSPSRPGSGCPSGTGTLNAINSVTINCPQGNPCGGRTPAAFQLYVVGTSYPNCSSGTAPTDVLFDNSVTFNGTIYAPCSDIRALNSVTMRGAIAARKVTFNNSVDFTYTQAALETIRGGSGHYYRQAWRECSGQPPPAVPPAPPNPEAGC